MRLNSIKTVCVLFVAFISMTVSGQEPQSLNYTFTSDADNWTTSSGSTFTVGSGLLYCNMANQDSDKYRGDLQYNSAGDAANNVTLNNQVDKLIAIKLIGGRPHGAMKFEMQRDTEGTLSWFNSKWNSGAPDGYVQTANGNVIYYFDLTKDDVYTNSGTSATFDIRRINIIIADAVAGSFTYAVDWIATFASIDDLEAYKNSKDDGDADTDEAERPDEVRSLYSPFTKFRDGWSLSNGAVLSTSAGRLICSEMGLTGEKYRADLQYNLLDRADCAIQMNSSKDKIFAVKLIGSLPGGRMKFEMKPSSGNWFNAANSSDAAIYNAQTAVITTDNNDEIYYFDLSGDTHYTGVAEPLIHRVNFIIADVVADAAPTYTVDWIASFETLNDLITFGNSTTHISPVSEETAVQIYGTKGGVVVTSSETSVVAIYNCVGQLVYRAVVSGDSFVALPKGIYVVNGSKVAVN